MGKMFNHIFSRKIFFINHFIFSLILTFSLVFVLSKKVYTEEENSLFIPLNMHGVKEKGESSDFKDKAAVEQELAHYRSQSAVVEIYLVKVNFDLLNSLNSKSSPGGVYLKAPLTVSLISSISEFSVEFNKIYLKQNPQSVLRVEAENTKTLDSVGLDVYFNEKLVWGQFDSGSNFYRIRPLKEDIHAFIQFDKSRVKPDIVIVPPPPEEIDN